VVSSHGMGKGFRQMRGVPSILWSVDNVQYNKVNKVRGMVGRLFSTKVDKVCMCLSRRIFAPPACSTTRLLRTGGFFAFRSRAFLPAAPNDRLNFRVVSLTGGVS
jgi:hypothetical protein